MLADKRLGAVLARSVLAEFPIDSSGFKSLGNLSLPKRAELATGFEPPQATDRSLWVATIRTGFRSVVRQLRILEA